MTMFEFGATEASGLPPETPGTSVLGVPDTAAQAPKKVLECLVRLYVAGGTPIARRAERSLRQLTATLPGRVDIEVIDVVSDPAAAEAAGVLATPLVVREAPGPRRRVVGDLTDATRLADALGLNDALWGREYRPLHG